MSLRDDLALLYRSGAWAYWRNTPAGQSDAAALKAYLDAVAAGQSPPYLPKLVSGDAFGAAERNILARLAPPPFPDSSPPPLPAALPPGSVLWSTPGRLADWQGAQPGGYGYSGGATGTDLASGGYGGGPCVQLKCTYPTLVVGETPGARLTRMTEPTANQSTPISFTYLCYIDQAYTFPGSWAAAIITQWKATSTAGYLANTGSDPFWVVTIENHGGVLVPAVVWEGGVNQEPGPSSGDGVSYRHYDSLSPGVKVPVGEWFTITTRIKQAGDYSGSVDFWINDLKRAGPLSGPHPIGSFSNVRTQHPDNRSSEGIACLYSNGMAPSPALMRIGAASISVVA